MGMYYPAFGLRLESPSTTFSCPQIESHYTKHPQFWVLGFFCDDYCCTVDEGVEVDPEGVSGCLPTRQTAGHTT